MEELPVPLPMLIFSSWAELSLAVYPAAGLVRYYAGNRLVLINRDQTPLDGSADLVLHGRIGEILGQV